MSVADANNGKRRVAIYARFSSDLQKDKLIDRQNDDLEKATARLGFKLEKHFSDRAQTATTLFERPGLTRDLMGAASRGEFDVVMVEQTDRLSRDRADLFWLAKRFKFFNVEIWTPAGVVSDMQLTFDGHSNEDFSRKLSGRVKSGHDKMSRDGKIAGGKCYGYNLVKDQPGERVTNETEAAIVRRIFTEYASGMTPRQIVAGLKRDGITSPTGKTVWNYQGICGADGGVTGAGMLHREFYRGKIVRDRIHYVKNPDTGRRVPRHSDADDIFTVDAPNLRIVSDDLWDAAHAVRRARRKQMNPNESNVAPTSALVRKPNLLGGLIRCSVCSGNMVIMSSARGGRIACSNATHRQTCDHTKSYAIDAITSDVIAKLDKELTDAEFLKRRMRARALELAKAEKEDNTERDQVQPDLERLKVQISRLVRALGDSDLPEDEIKAQMKIKEAQKAALSERLRLLGEGSNVTQILPAVMTAFGKDIETLIALLRRNPDDPRCRAALGNLIDCVVVHPTPKKQPYDLALYLRVSAIGNLKVFPKVRSHEKMLADEGVTYIASGNAPLPRINHFLSRHCY